MDEGEQHPLETTTHPNYMACGDAEEQGSSFGGQKIDDVVVTSKEGEIHQQLAPNLLPSRKCVPRICTGRRAVLLIMASLIGSMLFIHLAWNEPEGESKALSFFDMGGFGGFGGGFGGGGFGGFGGDDFGISDPFNSDPIFDTSPTFDFPSDPIIDTSPMIDSSPIMFDDDSSSFLDPFPSLLMPIPAPEPISLLMPIPAPEPIAPPPVIAFPPIAIPHPVLDIKPAGGGKVDAKVTVPINDNGDTTVSAHARVDHQTVTEADATLNSQLDENTDISGTVSKTIGGPLTGTVGIESKITPGTTVNVVDNTNGQTDFGIDSQINKDTSVSAKYSSAGDVAQFGVNHNLGDGASIGGTADTKGDVGVEFDKKIGKDGATIGVGVGDSPKGGVSAQVTAKIPF